MKQINTYSNWQTVVLVSLRFLTGWHILYEGISKALNPQWSSLGFLQQSKGLISGFTQWIISEKEILHVVDFMNTWGLIAIGLGIVLGLFFRVATVAGALLLIVYYLNSPPLIGLEYSIPADGNNLIVNKVLIEAAALCVLALFPTNITFGLDAFIDNHKNRKKKEEF